MMSGSAYGYGTVITQACIFAAMDRLGMAQYISRIGLSLMAIQVNHYNKPNKLG
jgi:phenol hydroxylase P1 protein